MRNDSARNWIPLAVPNLAGNEASYLSQCIKTTFVSSVGPFVTRFEQMVGESAGAEACAATCSGTAALQAALVAVGVEPSDLVIAPSMTFIASISAIHWSGGVPWLFDVDVESWTIDVQQIEKALQEETELQNGRLIHRASGARVAAILPVYTLGTPADMDPLSVIANRYGLPIVADAAAAVGATYKGRALAELGAELSIISFNGNKTTTAGGGGAVVGGAGTVGKVKHLTTTARIGDDYLHDVIGFNYRMTNLQAAVGVAQMELLDRFVSRKREIRAAYDLELHRFPDCTAFPQPSWADSACWFSGLVLEGRTFEQVRRVITALKADAIDARPFWRPMHLQPPLQGALQMDLPVTEALWFRVLTLPCSTSLTEAEQSHVIKSVSRVLKHV